MAKKLGRRAKPASRRRAPLGDAHSDPAAVGMRQGADTAARTPDEPSEAGDADTRTGGSGAKALVARAPKADGGEVTVLGQGRALIESLAAAGFTDTSIAARLRVSGSTLRECRKRDPLVAEALARGKARLEDEVVHRLLSAGRKGNITALIFLGKARFGWRDQGPVDGGGETKVAVQIVLPGAMSMADYERMVDTPPVITSGPRTGGKE